MKWQRLTGKLLVLSIAALMLTGCFFADESIDICEKRLKETLVASSSYKRISVSVTPFHTVAKDEFLRGYMNAHGLRSYDGETPELLKSIADANAFTRGYASERYDSGEAKSKSVLIDFDAQNSYGAAIRGHYGCTFYLLSREPTPDIHETDLADGP